MLIKLSYQDYEKSMDKNDFIIRCINEYKNSAFYNYAIKAETYFDGCNDHIMNLKPLRVDLQNQKGITLDFAKIPSNIFKRLILQVCNYQLSEGIVINGIPIDELLGKKSSRKVLSGAINGMIHGISYAYVNDGKIKDMYKATNMFTIDDEWSDEPMIAVHFWKIENENGEQHYAQIFEKDGITNIKIDDGKATVLGQKEPYIQLVRRDEATGENIIGSENPIKLPIVRYYVNRDKRSELSPNIKSKIDNLDEIVSRNATFVSKTSMIYWLINTTGIGNPDDISNMVMELEKLGISVNEDDGLSASPHVLDPQVTPRLDTKQSLEDDIYKDFMSLNLEALTKGNLTATAINTSGAMLKMKASDLYYYTSDFLEQVCELCNIEVSSIVMKASIISNNLEFTQMIYLARTDLTRKKTLELLPFIEDDEVESILNDLDVEEMTGSNNLNLEE